MIKLNVLSKMWAEDIGEFSDEVLVISIGSPGGSNAKVKGNNVFFFKLHDIQEQLFIDHENRIILPMEKETAEAIVEVAFNNRDKKRWVIHCEAGISRSPGIALGLARFIEFDRSINSLEKSYPCHNKHVRKLIEGAGIKKRKEIEENLKKEL